MSKLIIALLVFGLILAPLAFAGCAADSYRKACGSCSFDQYGKIDQTCSGGYKTSGTTCVSASYPIMAAKYAEGKCPEVDSCASELQSCVAQVSTGNDKADCQDGSVAVCYATADGCTKSAAAKCNDIVSDPCPSPVDIFAFIFAGLVFVRIRK